MRVSTAVCTLWERKLRTFPKILMSTGSSYTKAPRILTWSPAPVTRGMALCGVVKGGTTPQHHAPAGPAGLGTFCMAQMLHCFGWPLTYDVTPAATHLVPAIRSLHLPGSAPGVSSQVLRRCPWGWTLSILGVVNTPPCAPGC